MPQSHFVLIFFLWLIWVKQSIIFNSVLFLHYVTCSWGQHWHAGWKIVPSISLHPLVVSISSTLLKAALLLPLLGLSKSFLLEMLCCTFPRLGCGWLCPAWQEVVCWFLSWVFKSSQRCSMFSLLGSQVELSWLWTPRKAFFPSTLAQILSWCKALLPAPAVFNIYLAAPSSFTSRLCYPALVPQNTQISRKKKSGRGRNLKSLCWWWNLSILCPDLLAVFSSFFFPSWKASPFLPGLSQPQIGTAERMAVLKSLSFTPRLPLSVFHVLLSLGSATLSLLSPPPPPPPRVTRPILLCPGRCVLAFPPAQETLLIPQPLCLSQELQFWELLLHSGGFSFCKIL